jgi:pyridoxamine 5'-phosphate oxidase-like protein
VASWREFEQDAPELAAAVRERFERRAHKTIATLRRDGSPRISGTECKLEDGELRFGAMWHSVKALDLLRDPRFALHSGPGEPPEWDGDAKVAGTVRADVRESPEHGRYHLFTADIREAALVRLNEARDKLVIESWHEGRGRSRVER